MRYKPYFLTLLFAIFSILLTICMISFPQEALQASLRGLKIWWDVVFPALLPFMILSELMMGFGVVHFIGVVLEPLMRPLFNVPGTGGFVMALGFSSGYPVGPKLTANLRKQKLVSRAEGERLVCYTSTSDPLFMFGAVAVGFFQDASLGVTISISNYFGALLIGILLRFHDRKGVQTPYTRDTDRHIVHRALQAMHRARLKEPRPLGQLMGEAVLSSFQTLFVIGGFIIIFSVIIKFISMGALSAFLSNGLGIILSFFHVPNVLSEVLIIGFFEVTQSMQYMSELGTPIAMNIKIAIASALVAWGGISVHAQVASIISTTDLRYKPYFVWKIFHAFITGGIAYIVSTPLQSITFIENTAPVFSHYFNKSFVSSHWVNIQQLGLFMSIVLIGLCLLSLSIHCLYRNKVN